MTALLSAVLLPQTVAAGDSWSLAVSPSEYLPSDGWTGATLYLNGGTLLALAGVADADNAGWTFVATTTETADLIAGRYTAALRLTNGSDTTTIPLDALTVTLDIAAADPNAFLAHEERAIPVLEASILKRCAADLVSYQITTRQATREQLLEMQQLLNQYRLTVAMQRNGGKLPPYRFVMQRAGA